MTESIFDLLQRAPAEHAERVYGVVSAVVTSNDDPDGRGRVKLRFPWLAAEGKAESSWARVATAMAGKERGTYFLPEVDDEVLVAFEHGDIRFPYVIGALWNANALPPEKNDGGKNDKRAIRSRSGNVLRFDDTQDAEKIEIANKDGTVSVVIDTKNEKITIQAEKSGVEITSTDGKLVLSGKGVEITSSAELKLHADQDLEATADGTSTIKGSTVNIN